MRWPWVRSGEPARTPPAFLRRALGLVLAGDLAAAEQELAEAARDDPSTIDVYLALANLLRARGDIGRAIQIHQNLLLRPGLPADVGREALLGLALDFRAGGFLQRAAASFRDLLEVEPGNLQALRELERIQVETGDWEAAIGSRRRIGSADPRTPQVLAHLWSGLGRARLQEGAETEARRAFRRALSQDRSCAEAYLALGDLALRKGRVRKAIGHWGRTLDLHPAIGLVLYPRLWEAYESLGELEAFEALLSERIEKEPEDREASVWLTRVRVRQGRIGDGIAVLRSALSRDPTFLGAYAEIGRTLLREHREADALKTFEELLERIPDERSPLRCRACGTQDPHLHWRCPQCGEWDSFV